MRAIVPSLVVLAACGSGGKLIDAMAGTIDAAVAPMADAPMADAPVVDAPVVDAPVVDAPVVDAPVVDAPVVDAPVVDSAPPDAPPDAKSSVVEVLPSCTGITPALKVTIKPPYVLTYADMAATSIKAGDVVEFKTQSIHDATSGVAGTPDGIFRVDFNKDQCLKFTAKGDYPFYCSVHLFAATIVVQ
jgi:plastocyanin